jgi:hypothetical protein
MVRKWDGGTFDCFDLVRAFQSPALPWQPADYRDDSVLIVLERIKKNQRIKT